MKFPHTHNVFLSKKRGFTFLELLIAMAILTILMLVTTRIFVDSFGSYKATTDIENNIADAQFLMNLVAKELRTSTIVLPSSSGDSQSIKFFERSKEECIQYRFNSTSRTIEVARTSAGTSFSSCDNASNLTGFEEVGIGEVTGSFYSVPSEPLDPGPGRVGRVTMTISVESGDSEPIYLQTTTSLRDYGYIGL